MRLWLLSSSELLQLEDGGGLVPAVAVSGVGPTDGALADDCGFGFDYPFGCDCLLGLNCLLGCDCLLGLNCLLGCDRLLGFDCLPGWEIRLECDSPPGWDWHFGSWQQLWPALWLRAESRLTPTDGALIDEWGFESDCPLGCHCLFGCDRHFGWVWVGFGLGWLDLI